ncbi:hypothetical protein B484DRAFT_324731 [Ochromonadaceae sp. CCMP2298]|nr:hypothetical protein B484DRAFT_324731 [Ochromonadaceae sp. CCMP2298]
MEALDALATLEAQVGEEVESEDEEDEGGLLSADTLAALRAFAQENGVCFGGEGGAGSDVIDSVRKHFEVKEREDVFKIEYASKDGQREVKYELKGIKRELSQTLNSTGLTIWRAAEHLGQFVTDHPELFQGRSICELGAGLGLVAVLIDKLGYSNNKDTEGSLLVATDGDEDTVSLLIENKFGNGCSFDASFLYWGKYDEFLTLYPQKFEVLMAADVIYEEAQVEPLVETVCAIMKENTGVFYLAFARRNVKIDLVFEKAAASGLKWSIVDDTPEGIGGVEPIYCFTWA